MEPKGFHFRPEFTRPNARNGFEEIVMHVAHGEPNQ